MDQRLSQTQIITTMPITTINSLPSYISPEEHQQLTASTPSSFSDIPPVLRRKQDNVRVVFDPPVSDFSEDELKKGTVYILESALVFVSGSSSRGFQIDYPSIILHAISRTDPQSIYCQLGERASEEGTQGGVGEADDDDDEGSDLRELNIYPEDVNATNDSLLTQLFEALSYCASLHPDPASDSDDDAVGEDDDDAFVDADVEAIQAITAEGADGEFELNEAGRATLERLESLIQDDHLVGSIAINGHGAPPTTGSEVEEGRFADAEPRS